MSASSLNKVPSSPGLPRAADGGWGWVIVAVSFFYQALVDGSFSVIAVFMPQFVEKFEAGSGRTAMVGSVFMASMLISGPLVSFLANLLGCRAVAMVGGILLSLGYVLATVSPTVEVLILTLGFIGGFGLGMLYLPSVVMCGNYFERKRALAMGIAASGAGIGMLVFAPLSSALLSVYDWQNALRLLACVTLQSVVCGALLRPLTVDTKQALDSEDTESTSAYDDEVTKREGDVTPVVTVLTPSPDRLRKAAFLNSAATKTRILSNPELDSRSHDSLPSQFHTESHQISPQEKDSVKNISFHDVSQPHNDNQLQKNHSVNENQLSRTYDNLHTIRVPDSENLHRNYYSYNDVNSTDKERAGKKLNKKEPSASPKRRDHFLLNPLLRKDVFYSGSIARLPEYRSQPQIYQANVIGDEVQKLEEIAADNEKSCLCVKQKHFYILNKMLDVSLVTNGYFIVICLANMCMQMAYFIPIMFITDYAESINISAAMAASLISFFGISNTCGRLVGGALANLSCVNSIHVAGLSMMGAGLCTCLCVYCTHYPLLAVCVATQGFTLAPIIPLTNIFLVDFLGLDRLTNAVGLMSLAKGVASLFGAPLAGFLLDQTRSFRACFFLAGSLFTASGLLHYVLPLITKYRHKTFQPSNTENLAT